MARKVLVNEFSWSKTRHERFAECRRAYFLYYYASWGGWDVTAPKWKRHLYVLKKLSNRYTWAGSVVHAAIRGALMAVRHGRTLDPSKVISRVHRVMRQDFLYSRQRFYWRDRLRKDFSGLVEHEYKEAIAADDWKTNWANVEAALNWFFSSSWLDRARALNRDDWLEVDFLDFDRSIFHIEGVRIFAVPDFAFRDGEMGTVIVDWKTGQPRDGYEEQVLGYAMYMNARYQLPVESMRAVLVYLNAGLEKTVTLDLSAVGRFRAHFEKSVEQMRSLLAEPTRNLPRGYEHFPQTDDLTACARCVFRRVCRREAAIAHAHVVAKPLSMEPPSEPQA